jgi:hypothetical protein
MPSCGDLGAGLLVPDFEGLGTSLAVGLCCHPVASCTEVPIDEGMGRQEALGMPRRCESLHLSLSASRWSMRVFRTIIEVAALPVLDLGQELTLRYAVAGQLVSDEDARRIVQTLQQPLEEALCRSRIAVALHQDIEHDPVLIDGAPEIMQSASDAEENLVQVSLVARTRPSAPKLPGKGCTELQAPSADAFMGDNHAALGQEQFDVAKAQTEHVVEPDSVPDQLSREAVTIVRIGWLLHLTSLA